MHRREKKIADLMLGLHLTVVSPTGRAPMDEAIAEIFPGAARSLVERFDIEPLSDFSGK